MTKRALVVGIDDYPGGARLLGCVADAITVSDLLRKNEDGSPNFDCRVITKSDELDRHGLNQGLEELFRNCKQQDLLFYFSGHGRSRRVGTELVTSDLDGVSVGDLLAMANQSHATTVTLVIDCCYGGDLGNPGAMQSGQLDASSRDSLAVLREGVTIMSASLDTEVAIEQGGHGVFTKLLLDALEGGASDHLGRVTALSAYEHASRALGSWDQRPMFKSHIRRPNTLRTCKPQLDVELLRQLTAHFSAATATVQMTPEHEGEGRPTLEGTGTPQQQQFDYFKQLRNAGLLETAANQDLYFVAINNGTVFLSKMGRYFWDLAKKGRL